MMKLYFQMSLGGEAPTIASFSLPFLSPSIVQEASPLPPTFLNISGFNNFPPELLRCLDWDGRPDIGFWEAIFGSKPAPNFYKKIITTNTIDANNYCVNVTYTEVDLTPEELEEKKTRIKKQNTPTRDNYLRLTDFTQLYDAPISEQAKLDFVNYRQQLRNMFDISDITKLAWPPMPTSAPNISLPPYPPIDLN